jgi:hypothetical protein
MTLHRSQERSHYEEVVTTYVVISEIASFYSQ